MGRKKEVTPTKRRCVKLSDEHMRLLRMWGRGNASAGLRWIIEVSKLVVRRVEDVK